MSDKPQNELIGYLDGEALLGKIEARLSMIDHDLDRCVSELKQMGIAGSSHLIVTQINMAEAIGYTKDLLAEVREYRRKYFSFFSLSKDGGAQ